MKYSHITPGAGMVMKKAFGDDFPLRQVPGRASEPSKLGSTMAAAAELFVDGGSGL
jgi:hypothetical protein